MPVPEPRNSTRAVIRRVRSGGRVDVTSYGRPAVALVPPDGMSRRWLPRTDLVQRLRGAAADPGLRGDLEGLAEESTDDLPPLA